MARPSRHDQAFERECDVVVLGAGISGLTAAYRLTQQGSEVVVLEAKNRVGGRTDREEITSKPGTFLETGGQWFGPAHGEVIALGDELGMSRFESYVAGDHLIYRDGELTRFSETGDSDSLTSGPPLDPAAEQEFARILGLLEAMSSEVPIEAPWEAPMAETWDSMSLGAWLEREVERPEVLPELERYFTFFQVSLPHRYSLLQLVHYLATVGGFEPVQTAEQYRFEGGHVELSRRLAERLGERVRLETPVRVIDQTASDRVLVHADGVTVGAQACIVAMAPFDSRSIEYLPQLPLRREFVHDNYQSVGILKVQAVYETPFWRQQGLSGICYSDRRIAPLTFDNSPPAGTPGVLLTFLTTPGDGMWALSDEEAADPQRRRQAVLDSFAAYFGPDALEPVQYSEKNWMLEPYTSACRATIPPGFLTGARGALYAPVGRIHWCHSELGAHWGSGAWVNGGIDRAERVVREVAKTLAG